MREKKSQTFKEITHRERPLELKSPIEERQHTILITEKSKKN